MSGLRGFCAPVQRVEGTTGPSRVQVGFDEDDATLAITLQHADGTVLTAFLSVAQLGRFAHLVADLVEASDPPSAAGRTLQ